MASATLEKLKYLSGYPPQLQRQVLDLLKQDRLTALLLNKYPGIHDHRTDRALYDFAQDIKNRYMRKAGPVSKVVYDEKISVTRDALGLHTSDFTGTGQEAEV